MTAHQNRPKIPLMPTLRELCVKLGRNQGNRPNFAPVALFVGTDMILWIPPLGDNSTRKAILTIF
jgi:hypothetical protein